MADRLVIERLEFEGFVGIDESDVHPELRLRTQGAGRQVVPRIQVLDLVGERQGLADP